MIPARDPAEFKLFPAPAARFITEWLQWTDDNLRYLVNTFPISTLPAPGYRAVDGTCAMLDDEGYVFLFNPNMPAYTVNLTVDESMDISNASRFSLSLSLSLSLYVCGGEWWCVNGGGGDCGDVCVCW